MWSALKELVRQTLAPSVYDALAELYWRLLGIISAPLDGGSRLYWLNLAVFVVVAAGAFRVSRRKGVSLRGFLRHTFPRAVYMHTSAILDYKLYVLNTLLAPAQLVFRGFGTATVAAATAAALDGTFGTITEPTEPGIAALVALTLFTALAQDFAAYINHSLHHRIPVLWEIHKLHHSAEVLTPMTNFRNHPIYTIAQHLTGSLVVGVLLGLVVHAFALRATFLTLFGINVVMAVFNLLSNLRHSHIWISFGPVLSRIFVSPAQHQIHHSVAPEHRNKNYGLVFAVWDWMFGTLYVPRERESLTFGLGDGQPQPHTNLVSAYVGPVVGVWRYLKSGLMPTSKQRRLDGADIG